MMLLCFRFVASSVQDIDFFTLDLNQCPFSIGNEPPNYFAGTSRCKGSTMVSMKLYKIIKPVSTCIL